MTNEQIILNERLELMEKGIIGTTGRKLIIEEEDGTKVKIMEPEEIYTYKGWQEYQRQVKRGEKSIATILIWKHTVKKKDDSEEEIERMFMKKAFFFKREQTEQIENK